MTENVDSRDAAPEVPDLVEDVLAAPAHLSPLDRKIVEAFPGLVVRKDLTKGLKQNAVVPTYVLEYLLGQHCATDEPEALKAGLETVQRILSKHYVHRDQAELVKSTIKEKGRHRVIDRVTVELNDKGGFYEARFTNLGLTKVPIGDDFVRRHQKLLVGGIWAITELIYELNEDPKASPWHIETLKPIQVSGADYEEYLAAREAFSTEEWLGVLLQSIGLNPAMFDRRGMLLQLTRLIPYCERNYNLIELGPKGTGKSHVYAEFSPHGILISGGEITQAKLFVNNANGRIGLVGYWDCVCFDEFAGKDKNIDKNLVDIMKNYMANKSFSRGIEMLSAEASMVFMGNTRKSMPYMLKHSHFFDQLPDKYIDSAFLDRLHAFLPGWEVSPVRNEMFSSGYGFIVDYVAEILKHQRSEDFTRAYEDQFEIASEVSTRDQTGFEKTFSGLMKLIYPSGRATPDEIEELLSFAMESRRRVREHILRLDETFMRNDFTYRRLHDGAETTVLTVEEVQYPSAAGRKPAPAGDDENNEAAPPAEDAVVAPALAELIDAGESATLEFKATLRKNLHTGQPDPSVEHGSLKSIAAFLNTKGGTLVVGVADDGTTVGVQEDGFPTEDKMHVHLVNLIKARMGATHMLFVNVRFDEYYGQRVMVVECEPASTPVYLKDKDGKVERFYIRTGAATTELKLSETQPYLRRRFGAGA